MKLLIKYPTRGRPRLFQKTLPHWLSNLATDDYIAVISIDHDDPTMANSEMLNWITSQRNTSYVVGNSKTKVQAINADIPTTPWDVLVLASDDFRPNIYGYDNLIRQDMLAAFPDGSGALWYDDGYRSAKNWTPLCTLPIMGRELYDALGYIYYPGYKSVYCDDEYTLQLTSSHQLKKYEKCIIKHYWTDMTGKDELYTKNNDSEITAHDKELFRSRNRMRPPL